MHSSKSEQGRALSGVAKATAANGSTPPAGNGVGLISNSSSEYQEAVTAARQSYVYCSICSTCYAGGLPRQMASAANNTCEPRSTCGACAQPIPGNATAPCSETAAAAAAAVVAKATAANGSATPAGNAVGLVSNGSGEY
jgi:hypothetical protein